MNPREIRPKEWKRLCVPTGTKKNTVLLLLFSVESDSLRPQGHQASPSFTISWSLLRLMFIESMMPSNHLKYFCCSFLFSRGSSQPRDQPQVSHIAGRFFTSRATREAHITYISYETLILWLPDGKNWLILKDPDAGKDWGQIPCQSQACGSRKNSSTT